MATAAFQQRERDLNAEEHPTHLATAAAPLEVLEKAIQKRLMKVGRACVPDLLNEIDLEANEKEMFQAVESLCARGVLRQIPDSRAKNRHQYIYELSF